MDLLTAATGQFQSWLWNTDNPGSAYLAGATGERRQLPASIARGAGLGYAHHGYAQVLAAQGFGGEEMQALGLLDDNQQEVYGDRLTFPWTDMSGRHIVGLGGRAVVHRRPKYVNTPEPFFTKGSSVFGIHQAAAAIHQAGWAVIVEGPFDALALWTMGWTNAVATVGAKVTADQLAMVLRLTDLAVVLLDADEGGHRGREALASMLLRQPWPPASEVATATLHGAKDAGDPLATYEMVQESIRRSQTLPHI